MAEGTSLRLLQPAVLVAAGEPLGATAGLQQGGARAACGAPKRLWVRSWACLWWLPVLPNCLALKLSDLKRCIEAR